MSEPKDIIGFANKAVHRSLTAEGLDVEWFTEYHGRVNGEIDVFCNLKASPPYFEDRLNGNRGSAWEHDMGQCIRFYLDHDRKPLRGFFSGDGPLDYRTDTKKALDIAVEALELCESTSEFEMPEKFAQCMAMIHKTSKQALARIRSL